jgi:hypothetical protein
MKKFCLNGLKGWLHDVVKLTRGANRRKQKVAFYRHGIEFQRIPQRDPLREIATPGEGSV